VRIPMRFQRRGGRKRIVAPDGSANVPASKPHPDDTLLKALARAWRWQRMLDAGVYTSVSEIEEIIAGRTDQSVMLETLERPLPAGWEEQRRKIFPASDDLSSPRPPSLSDRQHLIRSWDDHLKNSCSGVRVSRPRD
jgi:hypothetical protein